MMTISFNLFFLKVIVAILIDLILFELEFAPSIEIIAG
jgi:hypothetical protein